MIDLRRLQIFLAVADSGSFTAAAATLYMSQPAVSQSIAQLELEIGEPLFVRTTRGVRLNDIGQQVRDRARDLLDHAVAFERDLRALRDGFTRITIGAFPTAGIELLPQAFGRLKEQRPDLRMAIKQLDAVDPVSLLREQNADLVLLFEYDLAPRPVDDAFVYAEVSLDPLYVLLPADHARAQQESITLVDLSEEQWVLRAHRAPYERIHDQLFARVGLRPDVVYWTDDYQSLQGLVAARVGVSIVPSLSLAQHRSDVVALPLRQAHSSRRVVLVAPLSYVDTEEYRVILETLRTVARH